MINAYTSANNNFNAPINIKINSTNFASEKIEYINQAMKIHRTKQDILLNLDDSAREKLAIMARIMIQQNSDDDI